MPQYVEGHQKKRGQTELLHGLNFPGFVVFHKSIAKRNHQKKTNEYKKMILNWLIVPSFVPLKHENHAVVVFNMVMLGTLWPFLAFLLFHQTFCSVHIGPDLFEDFRHAPSRYRSGGRLETYKPGPLIEETRLPKGVAPGNQMSSILEILSSSLQPDD